MTTEDIRLVENAILKRRSVRHFTSEKIPADTLRRLVKAGIYAPSGSNWQNQRFLIVDQPEELMRLGKHRFVWPYKNANLERVKKSHPGGIIGNATAAIIVFSDSYQNDRRGNGEYYIWEGLETQNCSASIQNILTLATALKIGSCWISASDSMNYTRLFSGKSWRSVLTGYEIPECFKLQGIVILGHPKSYEDGYPAGEKKHGATIWQSTERKNVDFYLINQKDNQKYKENSDPIRISILDKIQVRVFSRLIQIARRLSNFCDRKIHSIEIVKYLDRNSEG